ncbi:MAG: hypothetical protein ACOXZR_04705 [Bacilli bacterium]|jgi:thymidine kinase
MIKVYIGPMYSGKTTAIIDLYLNTWNKEEVLCFKPELDTRSHSKIKSRNIEQSIEAITIKRIEEIDKYLEDKITKIFIDEAQFLKGDVNYLLELSLIKNMEIHIAGLSLTSEQKPFGLMPEILSIADEIKIFKAICYICNKPAAYTYYNGKKETEILVGSKGYMPLCKECLLKKRNCQK